MQDEVDTPRYINHGGAGFQQHATTFIRNVADLVGLGSDPNPTSKNRPVPVLFINPFKNSYIVLDFISKLTIFSTKIVKNAFFNECWVQIYNKSWIRIRWRKFRTRIQQKGPDPSRSESRSATLFIGTLVDKIDSALQSYER